MTTSILRKAVPVLAIVLHLCSAVAVDYAHRHGLPTGMSRALAFMSHDCGQNERHLPLDGNRVCAVCVYASSIAGTAVAGHVATDLPEPSALPARQGCRDADSSDLFHCGKRGPPTA